MLYSSGRHISKYANLTESLFLQKSEMSIGIQMADMIAGAVWRMFERGDDRWYKLMESSLRQGPGGQVAGYGIIKVPKAGWISTPGGTVSPSAQCDGLPAAARYGLPKRQVNAAVSTNRGGIASLDTTARLKKTSVRIRSLDWSATTVQLRHPPIRQAAVRDTERLAVMPQGDHPQHRD